MAILSLFPWQMFETAPFFGPTSSDLYNWDTPCYSHNFESPSFSCVYKKIVTLRQVPSPQRTTTLWERQPPGCFPEHYNLHPLQVNRYHLYSHNVNFLSSNLSFISHKSFTINLLTVNLYIEWLSNLVLSEFCYFFKKPI